MDKSYLDNYLYLYEGNTMNGTNWTNISDFNDMLSAANQYSPFWTMMLLSSPPEITSDPLAENLTAFTPP